MKEIQLTQGKIALVSDCDYKMLSQFKWQAHQNQRGKWYAKRKFSMGKGERKTVFMHRYIMKPPPHLIVDHRNSNGLHNYRGNLRIVTILENCRNRQSVKVECCL